MVYTQKGKEEGEEVLQVERREEKSGIKQKYKGNCILNMRDCLEYEKVQRRLAVTDRALSNDDGTTAVTAAAAAQRLKKCISTIASTYVNCNNLNRSNQSCKSASCTCIRVFHLRLQVFQILKVGYARMSR